MDFDINEMIDCLDTNQDHDSNISLRKKELMKGRKGMDEVSRIVLNMQRDIKYTRNASTPQGAFKMVKDHNETAAESNKWHLNLMNEKGGIDIKNFTDVNGNGEPDIVIYDINNLPVYVNGYTTKKTKSPKQKNKEALPNGGGDNLFMKWKKECFPKEVQDQAFENARMSKLKGPQKMSKLLKAISHLWNIMILEPLFNDFDIDDPKERAKIKNTKDFKNALRQEVEDDINDDPDHFVDLLTNALQSFAK